MKVVYSQLSTGTPIFNFTYLLGYPLTKPI